MRVCVQDNQAVFSKTGGAFSKPVNMVIADIVLMKWTWISNATLLSESRHFRFCVKVGCTPDKTPLISKTGGAFSKPVNMVIADIVLMKKTWISNATLSSVARHF